MDILLQEYEDTLCKFNNMREEEIKHNNEEMSEESCNCYEKLKALKEEILNTDNKIIATIIKLRKFNLI